MDPGGFEPPASASSESRNSIGAGKAPLSGTDGVIGAGKAPLFAKAALFR